MSFSHNILLTVFEWAWTFANFFKLFVVRRDMFPSLSPRHKIFPSSRDDIWAVFDSSCRDFSTEFKFFDLKIFEFALAAKMAVGVTDMAKRGEEAFWKAETTFEHSEKSFAKFKRFDWKFIELWLKIKSKFKNAFLILIRNHCWNSRHDHFQSHRKLKSRMFSNPKVSQNLVAVQEKRFRCHLGYLGRNVEEHRLKFLILIIYK